MIEITDVIASLGFLFLGEAAPQPPNPGTTTYGKGSCGTDPSPDDPLDCGTPFGYCK